MNTRRNVLLYVMVTCLLTAGAFHYGQWSLGQARDAVERSIHKMTQPIPIKAKLADDNSSC